MSIVGIFGYKDIDIGDNFVMCVKMHKRNKAVLGPVSTDKWYVYIYHPDMSTLEIIINKDGAQLIWVPSLDRVDDDKTIANIPDITEYASKLDFSRSQSFRDLYEYCAKRFSEIISAINL